MTAVETLALVVAVVMADSNGDGNQNRVRGSSGGNNGMVVADNNRNCGGRQQSIKCRSLQRFWQRSCNGRQGRWCGKSDNNEGSGISNNSSGEFIPPFPLAMARL